MEKKDFLVDKEKNVFKGDERLPKNILELDTPLDFFQYFFSDGLLRQIANEFNLYRVQSNMNNSTTVKTNNIKIYIGICILTSVHHVPCIRNNLECQDWKQNHSRDHVCPAI